MSKSNYDDLETSLSFRLDEILMDPELRALYLGDRRWAKYYAKNKYGIDDGKSTLSKLLIENDMIHVIVPFSQTIVPYLDQDDESFQEEKLDPDHWSYQPSDIRDPLLDAPEYLDHDILQNQYEAVLRDLLSERNSKIDEIVWLRFIDSSRISMLLKFKKLPVRLDDGLARSIAENLYGAGNFLRKPEMNPMRLVTFISKYKLSSRTSKMLTDLQEDWNFDKVCTTLMYDVEEAIIDNHLLNEPEFVQLL